MSALISLLSGLIFGVGLMVSGMTQPGKVIGFLDIAGSWQWDLMGVMGGALIVNTMLYLWTKRRDAPLLGGAFPTFKVELDRRLIIGAALFGLGWGLGGFCPGPALTSLASAQVEVMTFVGAMIAGMLTVRVFDARR